VGWGRLGNNEVQRILSNTGKKGLKWNGYPGGLYAGIPGASNQIADAFTLEEAMINSNLSNNPPHSEQWPSLAFETWKNTYATLHLWTQIVGKIWLIQTPWVNHSWQVTLYVTTLGLTQ
jgi:hypothetical protein